MPAPRLLSICSTLLLLAPWAAAGDIDPSNPPQGLFSDEWMLATMGGQRAGYVHTTMAREGDRVTSRVISAFSLSRAGAPIEVSMIESVTETVQGVPLEFENSMQMASVTIVTRGRVRDGQVEIAKTQFGLTQTQRLPYPRGALMAGWGMYAEQLRRGFEPGTEYELDSYVPSLQTDKAVRTIIRVERREPIELLDGKKVEALRVVTTLASPMGSIDVTSWVTEDGTTLKSQMELMGLAIETYRTDKQTATQEIEAPELFLNTLVRADKHIDRQAARRLRLLLRVTGDGDGMPELPATGMQKPGKRTQDSVVLEISRLDHEALGQARLPAAGGDLAEYLRPNIWINSDDPQVIAMARDAAGEATAPYEIADRLRRYVTDIIQDKSLSVGFASASEVCRNKEGDCSEHAVLLAALGRVHRIPSRVVIGLVYVPWFAGSADVFGFHMWTQFRLGDQWVDFDAAQRESDCNPTHIAVLTSSLAESSLADLAFGIIGVIGRLEIDVLAAEPPGAIEGS